MGHGTLAVNTTGGYNTAVGMSALNLNTIGIFNTALGAYALSVNTTGQYNTAVGYEAMKSNIVGVEIVSPDKDLVEKSTLDELTRLKPLHDGITVKDPISYHQWNTNIIIKQTISS